METLTVSWTVNDVMRCFPMSIMVLNDIGIDTCCGGTQTLDLAAESAGMTPDDLIAALLPSTVPSERLPRTDAPVDYNI